MSIAYLKQTLRNLCLTAAVVVAAAAAAPGDVAVINAANAGNCTLVNEYVDENGNRWGVYNCSGRLVTRSCTRGCPWMVWDFRDEQ